MGGRTVAVQVASSVSDGQRTARTRRQRGYQWEETLVRRFNGAPGWRAFRLGSPSVGLPDVLAVNTGQSAICAIEAKSGTGTTLAVPFDQIERCLHWTGTFDVYRDRRALLAFKFLSKKRVGTGRYEPRQLREFYKVWDESVEPADCVCTYDGRLYTREGGRRSELVLAEADMPFRTWQRHGATGR